MKMVSKYFCKSYFTSIPLLISTKKISCIPLFHLEICVKKSKLAFFLGVYCLVVNLIYKFIRMLTWDPESSI